LISETFASAGAAATWFTDHPVDLGTFAGASTVDIQVAMAVSSNKPGSSFDAAFLVAGRV
jgi:hypothetical protein